MENERFVPVGPGRRAATSAAVRNTFQRKRMAQRGPSAIAGAATEGSRRRVSAADGSRWRTLGIIVVTSN